MENKELYEKNIYLNVIQWESFIDVVSQTRLQDEYAKAIMNADIFVMLLFTKAGRYREEEFESAFRNFKESGKPIIYTYFKDVTKVLSSINISDIKSLNSFKNKLNKLGHFQGKYKSIDELIYEFKIQLQKLINGKFLTNNWASEIENERIAKTGQLDLSGYNLKEIPRELLKMTWLEELYINNNQIERIENLDYLTNLKTLD